jgi:hypothetical protein
MKVLFKFVRDTKNTRLFQESAHDGVAVGEDKHIIGSLYVKKAAAGDREEITVSFPMPDEKKAEKAEKAEKSK